MAQSLADKDEYESRAQIQVVKNLGLIVRAELYDIHFTG
jgi:hypothetical protein